MPSDVFDGVSQNITSSAAASEADVEAVNFASDLERAIQASLQDQ